MFEELQLLKEIVGDLSSVGGWIAGGWILHKFIVSMTLMLGGGYLLFKVAKLVAAYFNSPISKEEAEVISEESLRLKKRLTESEHETERVKHMYKLLKEKRDVCGAS